MSWLGLGFFVLSLVGISFMCSVGVSLNNVCPSLWQSALQRYYCQITHSRWLSLLPFYFYFCSFLILMETLSILPLYHVVHLHWKQKEIGMSDTWLAIKESRFCNWRKWLWFALLCMSVSHTHNTQLLHTHINTSTHTHTQAHTHTHAHTHNLTPARTQVWIALESPVVKSNMELKKWEIRV